MESQPTLAELVVRDISGECLSHAEEAQVKAWSDENPAHARMLAHLRDARWRMQEWQRYKGVDKAAVWKQMQGRVETMPDEPPLPPLENTDWGGGPPSQGKSGRGRDRLMRCWAALAALIVYHNH